MAEQERGRPQRRDEGKKEDQPELKGTDSEAIEGIDDLLDEIDSVLEENAEEFIKNYVQKGGE